jgi:hypothetical protein
MTMISVITHKSESEITYVVANADPGEATRMQRTKRINRLNAEENFDVI